MVNLDQDLVDPEIGQEFMLGWKMLKYFNFYKIPESKRFIVKIQNAIVRTVVLLLHGTYHNFFSAKLLVATGYPWMTSVLTEVIDLADESTTCDTLDDHPIQVTRASGGLINGSLPLICGVWNGNGDCYIAGIATRDPVVKLLTPRDGSAAVAMGSHQLWITGGYDDSSEDVMFTEIVDFTSSPASVVRGPELPMPMDGHCIVKLNESTVLFMYRYKTFFFDYSAQAWTNGPDMSYDRYDFGCAIVKWGYGSSRVVVAGSVYGEGGSTSEFLMLDDPNGLKWSAGK